MKDLKENRNIAAAYNDNFFMTAMKMFLQKSRSYHKEDEDIFTIVPFIKEII